MYLSDIKSQVHYFDLEDPTALARLDDPKLALQDLEGLIVIDEIQRKPELFPLLRFLVDTKDKQRYLILGSASQTLLKQTSETLAGRIAYVELTPFGYTETKDLDTLWLRGGYPRSFLSHSLEESLDWRKEFVKTYLERDIPLMGLQVPAATLRRFWTMLAHYHASTFNASEIGRSLGFSDTTMRHYLDLLTDTFMVRQLKAFYDHNISKRQIKAPKVYFRDTGLLNIFTGISTKENLWGHPKLGLFWEGLAIEEILRAHEADSEDCYFWGTHSGAELDLLIQKDQRLGFEIKFSSTPKITPSMKIAKEALKLDSLIVIIPGSDTFPLAHDIQVVGLQRYLDQLCTD